MLYKGFVSSTYSLQSVSADCQRCINLIPQQDESGAGKAAITYIGTPGLKLLTNINGTNPSRCFYASSLGRVFEVSGNTLVELHADYTNTQLGSLLTHDGIVSIADNGLVLFIVDGPNGYTYDLTTGAFARILDEDFHGGDTVAFQDGYFIFNQPGTQDFWITGLYTPDIDGLAFAAAEGSPDKLISLLSDGQNVWLFGDTSTEVWYDSGDPNFPFQRIQGAFIKRGCAAKFSPKLLENTVFWLAKDEYGQGVVLRAQGYAPVRVSTHAMEQEIQRYPKISDAEAWTYQQDGHSFYVLNFPSAGKTWAFDAITGMWHERAYTGDGVLEQALPRNHCFGFGKHLVGSYADGNIYEMTPDVYTDAGNAITRLRRAPVINSENTRITFHSIEIDMETGLGDGVTDPQAILRFSDDSGKTWSNEKYASMGKIGEGTKRVIYRRLGQARNRVFELKVTDPVRCFISNAYLDLSGDR
jgi:hypothetical protein